MNVGRLLLTPCTIDLVAQDGAVDGFGDPTTTVTTTASRCWLHQAQRSEDTENADTQIEQWPLYLPAELAGVVDGTSRVTVGGQVFEMVGPPWPATNPRTLAVEHVECTVRRSV